MAQFSLDDIRAAAEKQYGDVTIDFNDGDSVRLVNPLRLEKGKRDKLAHVQDALDDSDSDQVEALKDALRLVSSSEDAANRLLDAIGDDLATLAQVFQTYNDGAAAGEA